MKTKKYTRVGRLSVEGKERSSSSASQALGYALGVLPYGQHRGFAPSLPALGKLKHHGEF